MPDGFTVSPSGYLHTVGQPLFGNRALKLGTQLAVAYEIQLDAKPLTTQLSQGFNKKQLSLLFGQTADGDELACVRDWACV